MAFVEQHDSVIAMIEPIAGMIPAFLFLVCMLVTVTLGTSWGMFAMAFPIAAQLASLGIVSLPLCFGAICAAGIAGEQNCMMTGIEIFVGENSGCNPKDALRVRMPYSLAITGICFVLYAIAGFVL
ncbi:MAG: hypothetical protein MJ114_05755 [Acetatifactor sp.]|nr:hypothetical protein [Acetatifactor sp.]